MVVRPLRGSESSGKSMETDGDPLFHRYNGRLGDDEKEHIHPFNLLPELPCTAHFNLPNKDLPTSDVFTDLKNCGIRAAGVRCLQRTPNGFVTITFSSADYRSVFKEVFLHSAPLYFYSLWQFYVYLSLYLRCYLRSALRATGRRSQTPPHVKHEGQVPNCRKCDLPDEVARSCPNVICFNCDQLGHTFRDCTEPIKCSICKEDGYYTVDCPLSWGRPPSSYHDDDPHDPC